MSVADRQRAGCAKAEQEGNVSPESAKTAATWRGHVRSVVVSTVCVVVMAGATGVAEAGSYTAWYCRDAAHRGIGFRDWSEEISGVGYVATTTIACPVGGDGGSFGPQVLPDSGNDPNLVSDGFSIEAPPDVRLESMRLFWTGSAGPNGEVSASAIDGTQETVLATYSNRTFGAPPGAGGVDSVYALGGARGVALRARCLAACQQGSEPIAEYLAYRVALSIGDYAAPQGRATGGLLVDPVLKGVQSVTVEGRDVGAGVYRAQVVVDGQIRATAGFAQAPCGDIDTSNSDTFEFATAQPCPSAASTTVALATSELGEDAYHHVVVQVVDAAGNATSLADRVVGVDNARSPEGFFDPVSRRFANPVFDMSVPRNPNGVGATADARLRVYLPVTRRVQGRQGDAHTITRGRLRRTVGFRSEATLRGVLMDASGQPVPDAAVWTASRIQGAEWRITGRPHMTTRRGRIGFRLPAGVPSREVNLVYFPFSDSHDQVVGRPVVLKVRAGLTLRTDRRLVHNGQRVTFVGRVRGRMPTHGATVALQAKVGQRFRTFRQVRVTRASRGRFSTSGTLFAVAISRILSATASTPFATTTGAAMAP